MNYVNNEPIGFDSSYLSESEKQMSVTDVSTDPFNKKTELMARSTSTFEKKEAEVSKSCIAYYILFQFYYITFKGPNIRHNF